MSHLARDKWLNIYAKAGASKALRVHVLGPSKKYTGGREGASQANFIRDVSATSTRRFNVHVNIKA